MSERVSEWVEVRLECQSALCVHTVSDRWAGEVRFVARLHFHLHPSDCHALPSTTHSRQPASRLWLRLRLATPLEPTAIDPLWRHEGGHSIGWGNREVQTRYEIQFYCFFVVSPSELRSAPSPAILNTLPSPLHSLPQLFQFIAFRRSTSRTLDSCAYITLIITT